MLEIDRRTSESISLQGLKEKWGKHTDIDPGSGNGSGGILKRLRITDDKSINHVCASQP